MRLFITFSLHSASISWIIEPSPQGLISSVTIFTNLATLCKKDILIPEFDRFFETPNLNVIWGLVAAIRYDFNDPQPRTQFKLLRTFFGEKLAGPITFVSWLRYIFPFSMIYSNIIKAMDSFRILLKHVIEDQK